METYLLGFRDGLCLIALAALPDWRHEFSFFGSIGHVNAPAPSLQIPRTTRQTRIQHPDQTFATEGLKVQT